MIRPEANSPWIFLLKDRAMRRVLLRLLMSVVMLVAAGCSRSRTATPAPGHSPAAGITGNARADDMTAREIKVLPEAPNATTDLIAVVSNMEATAYRWEKNGTPLEDEHDQRLSAGKFGKGDRITVTARSGGREATATVEIGNARPIVRSVFLNPKDMYRGVDITATPVGYDVDGDYLRYTYSWFINGKDCGEHSEVLKGNQFRKGDKISVTIVPADSQDDGIPFTSVPVTIPNAPPRFVSAPALNFTSRIYEYTAHAEDPDGDPVTYSLAQGPNGMTVNSTTGKVTWPITGSDGGVHTVEIRAQDNAGSVEYQKYTLTISIPGEEQK